MKRYARELIDALERLGFDYLWTNAQGFVCYVHPDDPAQTEMVFSQGIVEGRARDVLRRARKVAHTLPDTAKRHGAQVKERAAAERERAQRRLDLVEAKHARLVAERAEADRIAQAFELVERRRQELLALHRDMTDVPQGAGHRARGRVAHRSGTTTPAPL